jgi:hypothetical protein
MSYVRFDPRYHPCRAFSWTLEAFLNGQAHQTAHKRTPHPLSTPHFISHVCRTVHACVDDTRTRRNNPLRIPTTNDHSWNDCFSLVPNDLPSHKPDWKHWMLEHHLITGTNMSS